MGEIDQFSAFNISPNCYDHHFGCFRMNREFTGIDAAVLGFRSRVSSATRRNARMRGAYQLASNRLAVLQTYGQPCLRGAVR
jgi:hypothetical protein